MIWKRKESTDIDKTGVNLEINDLFVCLDSLKLFWNGGFTQKGAEYSTITVEDRFYFKLRTDVIRHQ